jgi:hypothetical protein
MMEDVVDKQFQNLFLILIENERIGLEMNEKKIVKTSIETSKGTDKMNAVEKFK